jgi:hypothetical protein
MVIDEVTAFLSLYPNVEVEIQHLCLFFFYLTKIIKFFFPYLFPGYYSLWSS